MTVLASRYKTEALACHWIRDALDIRFAPQDGKVADLCIKEMNEARHHVEMFFDYRPNVKLFIFMYPDLSAMNKAFGRELPDENCCFAPIRGPESLITFVTPRSNQRSLKAMLVHEYCHVVFGCLTGNREIGPIDQRVPTWLDDGVALFVDREFRENLPEIESERLERIRQGADDWWPNLENLYTYFNRLDGKTEFGQRGMLAYAYSYFCVKELIRRFSKQTFVQFAVSIASCSDIPSLFYQTFGFSVAQFNSEMKISLRKSP